MAFPEDYLVASGPRSSIVRAEKYFNNTLAANSVDTDGLINGRNPVDAITLSDRQEWLGSAVFNNLEVSEILEVSKKNKKLIIYMFIICTMGCLHVMIS